MLKNILLLLVACIVLFNVVSIEAIISPGKCADVPADKNFLPAKYVGSWYEIERFNYIFEDLLKCLVATYGAINSTHVTVHNEGVNIITGQVQGVEGYAYIPDPSAPNKLLVNLPITFENQTIVHSTANYQVADTDYVTYALVYSCKQVLAYKDEFVWILSRQKTLDVKYVNTLKDKLVKMGVDTKHLVVIDQNC